MHFALAALLSLPLASAGYVVDQTVRWTDHLDGLENGLFHMVFLSMAWPIYMIPWCLSVFFCYRRRESRRHRTLWILGPAIFMSLLTVAGLVFQPPSAARRFEGFTKAQLPANLSDLETHFSGGGFYDYGDTYYFKASSSEIDRLIKEMKLVEDEYFGKDGTVKTIPMIKPFPGSPDFKNWKGARQYKWFNSRHHWFSCLITDSEKTQAYIYVGCT